jgi:solute carrier family 25 phosphate transporter 23/24/25/41
MSRNPPNSAASDDSTRALFDSIKSANSGVTKSDLERYLKDASTTHADSDKVVQQMAVRLFAQLGGDSSHSVTFEQFNKVVSNRISQLNALFAKMDRDGDMSIDRDELRSRFREEGLQVPDAFLQKFIQRIDENNDQKIQLPELLHFALLIPGEPTLSSISTYLIARFEPNFDLAPVHRQHGSFDWKAFLAGGISGALSRTVTAPIDRLRVYLQVAVKPEAGSALVAAARTIYSEAGIISFWKGNMLNILKIVPETALLFGLFDGSKQLLASSRGVGIGELTPTDKFLAGGLAGVTSQTLMYPLDSVRTRLMSNLSHTGEGQGSIKGELGKALKQMTREGVPAFFRGWLPASMGIFPFSGINLAVFETLKLRMLARRPKKSLTTMETLVAGSIAGGTAATITFPLNLARTRMQAANTTLHQHSYDGFLDCVRVVARTEGWRGFYRGLGVSLMKAGGGVRRGHELRQLIGRSFQPTGPSFVITLVSLLRGGEEGFVIFPRTLFGHGGISCFLCQRNVNFRFPLSLNTTIMIKLQE